jgi:hypothetical protein
MLLPALAPEPCLVGAVRQQRMQLDHPIVTLDDLHLRAGLVEVIAVADLGRQRDRPAAR